MRKSPVYCSLLLTVSLFAFSLKAPAQDAVVKKIIHEGTTNNQTQKHLDILTNRIGGRPVGSDAYNAAVQWAAAQFESWGLEVSILSLIHI